MNERKRKPPSEAVLEAQLLRELRRRGVKAIKQYGETGIPDRLVIVPRAGTAYYVWVELKADGGVVSSDQRAYHADLLRIGARVRIVRGRIGLMDFLHEVDAVAGNAS